MHREIVKVDKSTRLDWLPEDVLLMVLEYCEKTSIDNTREFQSAWVQECTRGICIIEAINANNLHNMKWIMKRNATRDFHGSFYTFECAAKYGILKSWNG